MVLQSNLLILKCYKNVFNYKYFVKNTGNYIVLTIIFFQTFTAFFFYFINSKKINKYIFSLMDSYLSYLDKTNISKDKAKIISFLKNVSNPPKKDNNEFENMNIKRFAKKHKTVIYQNNSKNIILNIKKMELSKDSHKNLIKRHSKKKHSALKLSNFNTIIFKNGKKRKSNKTNENKQEKELKQKLNNFMDNYLSTEINYKDYDDAIKLDKRKFFEYFWEKVKSAYFILDIILVKETLKTRPIKILLLLIKIDLHFLINALFMNEDYISEIYHSKNDDGFFSFIKRMRNNLFYISTIGAFSSYLINCFFFDERGAVRFLL